MAAGQVGRASPDRGSTPLPRNIGRPATAALEAAGYSSLESLDGASAAKILGLHGVGPAAIERLRMALAAVGRGFRD